MQEFNRGIKGFSLQIVLWAIVVIAGLYIAGHTAKIAGFLVGTAASLLYLLLLYYRVRKSVALPPRKAVFYMRTGWLSRLAFVISILILSLKVPHINFPAAVVGLFSLQISILFNGFYLVTKQFVIKRILPRKG